MPVPSSHASISGDVGDKEEKTERALGIGTSGTGSPQPSAALTQRVSPWQALKQSHLEFDINVTC